MPALPSVANIIRSGFLFGQPAGEALGKVALHFAFTGGPPSAAQLIDIGNQFMNATDAHLKSLTPNAIHWQSATLTDLTSSTSATGESTHASIAGTRGASSVATPLCVMTNYLVSRRYRGGHPKSFWPFGVVGDLGDYNHWDNTLIADVDAGVPAFITACLAASSGGVAISDWVQVSYFHGFTPFTEPSGRVRNIPNVRATPLVDPLAYAFASSIFGVQKRRRGKV